jgi:Spy/CpxP family protein refolding chaperone
MLFRTRVIITGLVLGLSSFAAEALAQQTQTTTAPNTVQQERRQGMRQRGKLRHGRARARMLQELNLTDQQKEQARTIMQNNRQGMGGQRQELRQLTQQWRQGTLSAEGLARAKELRAQRAEHRKGMRTQLSGILTAEQKAKLEEAMKARRTNHGRFGKRNQPLN